MTLLNRINIARELKTAGALKVPHHPEIGFVRLSKNNFPLNGAHLRKFLSLKVILHALKKKLDQWLQSPPTAKPFFLARPKLSPPILPPEGSYRPPRYFSKGAVDFDRKKNPPPIPYLLMETREHAQPRPVPGNSILLRSLCKGKGVLKRGRDGMIYLDIDNRFITAIFPFLKAYQVMRPPYFTLFGSAPEGAHIPVVPSREATFHYLSDIRELGMEFSFEIEGLYSIEPTLWPEMEEVWFFKLHSPELEKLRRRYFLTPTPGCHPFHIAVAVKPRSGTSLGAHPIPVMRINIGYLAA